jgi:hypothetical protein
MPKPLENRDDSLAYSLALCDLFKEVMQGYTQDLIDSKTTVKQWHSSMSDSLKTLIGLQAITGKSTDPGSVDWNQVEKRLADQNSYLDSFALEVTQAIEDENDITGILYRAGLYADASKAQFWASFSPVEMPAYPGDSNQECGANCMCEWEFTYKSPNQIECMWVVNDDNPCDDCTDHGEYWNPITVKIGSHGEITITDDSGQPVEPDTLGD